MDLLLQLQQDLADKINSESAFSSIWCGTYRAMVVAQEIEKRAPHLTGKNGSKGCGILVLMPTLHGIFPNVSPPQGEVKLGFWIVENPEINFNAGGTQLACEQVARMVRQCVNLFQIEGKLAFYQEATVMAPIHGLEKTYPGCCGYQVNMTGRMSETAVAKCALPTLSEGSLTVALATTDEGGDLLHGGWDVSGGGERGAGGDGGSLHGAVHGGGGADGAVGGVPRWLLRFGLRTGSDFELRLKIGD